METLDKVYEFAYNRNREGIILDTVVLLLYFIGKFDVNYIKDFEPTHNFSNEDYKLLNRIINPFKRIIITPQILAELSNHSKKYMVDKKLHHYLAMVFNFLRDKEKIEEYHMRIEDWDNKEISRLCKFGFVDLNMYEVSKKYNIPIITDEEDLYNYSKKEIPIIKLSIIKYANFKR